MILHCNTFYMIYLRILILILFFCFFFFFVLFFGFKWLLDPLNFVNPLTEVI